MLMTFPLLPGTRNQSKLCTHAVVLVVGAIDGAMEDEGEVKTNGDIFGLLGVVGEALGFVVGQVPQVT